MTQIPSHGVIKTKLSWMRDILLRCRREEGAGLQIALQLPTADSHLEPATITTILLSFADHQEFSYYWQSVLPCHYFIVVHFGMRYTGWHLAAQSAGSLALEWGSEAGRWKCERNIMFYRSESRIGETVCIKDNRIWHEILMLIFSFNYV